MQHYESRTAQVDYPAVIVYDFFSDFTHFEQMLPAEQVDHWETDGDNCTFEMPGIGPIGLKMVEKRPTEFIKIAGDSSANIDFNLLIYLEENSTDQSRIRLILQADLNVFVRAVAEKPLKKFLEILISHIESFDFEKGLPKDD